MKKTSLQIFGVEFFFFFFFLSFFRFALWSLYLSLGRFGKHERRFKYQRCINSRKGGGRGANWVRGFGGVGGLCVFLFSSQHGSLAKSEYLFVFVLSSIINLSTLYPSPP